MRGGKKHHHEKEGLPPKGCMTIRVGPDGEEQRKLIVPVEYLKHPLFLPLLKLAEDKYGFEQKGAITIPCSVKEFQDVQEAIHQKTSAVTSAHRNHQHLCLAGCFRVD